MRYAIVIVLAILVISVFLFVRRFRQGQRLVSSLLSGNFDESPVERQLAVWFDERPSRKEQREQFVGLTLSMKCQSGVVADRLMHCITEIWAGRGAHFGDSLARELDRLVVFDPPADQEQAEKQRTARRMLDDFKTRLRGLD